MTFDDSVLGCKSTPEWWELERSGAKPNTVRVVRTDELLALGRCQTIHVTNTETGEAFDRPIAGIYDMTEAMKASGIRGAYDRRYVIVCWDPREEEK